MQRTLSRLAITIALAICLAHIPSASRAQGNAQGIHWLSTYQSAIEESRRTGKPIMVDIYADWCPQCHGMDNDTFPNPKVVALSSKFVCLKVDAEKGEGPKIAQHFKIRGYPTIAFTDPGFKKVHLFDAFRDAADTVIEMVRALLLYGASQASVTPPKNTVVWRVLLLVVPSIDVTITENGQPRHIVEKLSNQDMQAAEQSFTQFATLVPRLTNGFVRIVPKVVRATESITQVTAISGLGYAPVAKDVSSIIEAQDGADTYDSIMVYFKGSSLMRSWVLPSKPTKLNATYMIVRDVPEQYWKTDHAGEVFLNGWTHGVADYLRSEGYANNLPPLDSGGGEAYGYRRSGEVGWCSYYFPLFNGLVPVDGALKGIDADLWRLGAPRHPGVRVTTKAP